MSGAAALALVGFNAVLQQTTTAYLDRARAYPFLKGAGGKRALVPETVKVTRRLTYRDQKGRGHPPRATGLKRLLSASSKT